MARGEQEDRNAKGMRWVDSKVKDGKGGFVKMRTNKPAEEAPKAAPVKSAAPKKAAAPAKKAEAPVTKDAMKGYRKGDVTTSKLDTLSGASRSTAGKVKPKGILKDVSASASGSAGATGKGREAPVGGKLGIMPPKLSPQEMVKLTPLERAKRNQQATLARAAQRKSGMAKGGMASKKGC